MSEIIRLEGVQFRYARAEKPCIKGLDLTIHAGEFLGITGPTGAGKTTLTYLLNGIIPCTIPGELTGEIRVGPHQTHEVGPAILGRFLATVSGDPEGQIVSVHVEEEVAFGPENLGLPSEEIARRVDDALEMVGITHLRKKACAALSGGQKQRVAIAAALAMHPQVLVLDEPTSELDPGGTAEVFRCLQRLNQEHQMTIILIEQKIEWLARLADRLMIFSEGRIAMEGSPREVLGQREALERLGVEPPEVTQAALLLRGEGWRIGQLPLTVAEAIESFKRGEPR